MVAKIFGKSSEIEGKVNKYLDLVDKAVLIFKRDVSYYISKNYEVFNENLAEIKEVENQADDYQKDVKYKIYQYSLIPDLRGDVLELVETTDNIVDFCKKVIFQLAIEKPQIPGFLEEDFLQLVDKVAATGDALVKCIRSFFQEIALVNDYVNKVHFYEHEADKIEERIKRKVFSSGDIDNLCLKVHLRYFAEKIAYLSDEAEKISEKVSIAAIKRSI